MRFGRFRFSFQTDSASIGALSGRGEVLVVQALPQVLVRVVRKALHAEVRDRGREMRPELRVLRQGVAVLLVTALVPDSVRA